MNVDEVELLTRVASLYYLEDETQAEIAAALGLSRPKVARLLSKARALLPSAPVVRPAPAPRAGFVQAVNAREVGLVVVELGGGRRRASDSVDPAVGLTELVGIGAELWAGEPLALVHARDEGAAALAAARLAAAYTLGDASPQRRPAVIERIAP